MAYAKVINGFVTEQRRQLLDDVPNPEEWTEFPDDLLGNLLIVRDGVVAVMTDDEKAASLAASATPPAA